MIKYINKIVSECRGCKYFNETPEDKTQAGTCDSSNPEFFENMTILTHEVHFQNGDPCVGFKAKNKNVIIV